MDHASAFTTRGEKGSSTQRIIAAYSSSYMDPD